MLFALKLNLHCPVTHVDIFFTQYAHTSTYLLEEVFHSRSSSVQYSLRIYLNYIFFLYIFFFFQLGRGWISQQVDSFEQQSSRDWAGGKSTSASVHSHWPLVNRVFCGSVLLSNLRENHYGTVDSRRFTHRHPKESPPSHHMMKQWRVICILLTMFILAANFCEDLMRG